MSSISNYSWSLSLTVPEIIVKVKPLMKIECCTSKISLQRKSQSFERNLFAKITQPLPYFYFQTSTTLVSLHNGFPETCSSIFRRHGLLHNLIIHDVSYGVHVHFTLQLENDKNDGVLYVYLLFHFCCYNSRLWIWLLRMSALKSETFQDCFTNRILKHLKCLVILYQLIIFPF